MAGQRQGICNVLEWAVITAQKDLIRPAHLPEMIGSQRVTAGAVAWSNGKMARCTFELGRNLEEVKREYVAETLKSVNQDRTARPSSWGSACGPCTIGSRNLSKTQGQLHEQSAGCSSCRP